MLGYRLSALRSKGWIRLGLIGALTMLPLTGMEFAHGVFSEGPKGLEQAGEYLLSGVSIWLIFGFSASWIAHGFAVRAKESDESDYTPARSGGRAPAAGQGHAAPAKSH